MRHWKVCKDGETSQLKSKLLSGVGLPEDQPLGNLSGQSISLQLSDPESERKGSSSDSKLRNL